MTNEAKRNDEYGQPALLALVRFLAKYQADLNDLRDQCIGMTPEECKDALIMKWPKIQGMANQAALKRIGELDYDTKLVSQAVNAIVAEPHASAGSVSTPEQPPAPEWTDPPVNPSRSSSFLEAMTAKCLCYHALRPCNGCLSGGPCDNIQEDSPCTQ